MLRINLLLLHIILLAQVPISAIPPAEQATEQTPEFLTVTAEALDAMQINLIAEHGKAVATIVIAGIIFTLLAQQDCNQRIRIAMHEKELPEWLEKMGPNDVALGYEKLIKTLDHKILMELKLLD